MLLLWHSETREIPRFSLSQKVFSRSLLSIRRLFHLPFPHVERICYLCIKDVGSSPVWRQRLYTGSIGWSILKRHEVCQCHGLTCLPLIHLCGTGKDLTFYLKILCQILRISIFVSVFLTDFSNQGMVCPFRNAFEWLTIVLLPGASHLSRLKIRSWKTWLK